MDWGKWEDVKQYLIKNEYKISLEVWNNIKKRDEESLDFNYLKEKFFKEEIVDRKGNVKGRKILFNALRKYYGTLNKVIFIEGDVSHFYVFTGRCYERVPMSELDHFLYENVLEFDDLIGLLPNDYNTFRVNMTAVQRSSIKTLTDSTQFFLNFRNGILDVRDLSFRPNTHEKFLTYYIPYDYTTTSDATPMWDKLMNLVFSDDPEYKNLYEFYLGYTLSMNTSKDFQFFLMLTGQGENGKTYLLNVTKSILSENLYTVQSLKKIMEERFSSAVLENKIAIFADDENAKVFENAEFLKRLVGGNEFIQIEKKFVDSYEIKAMAKPFITTNAMPYLPDTSYGFQRRFLIIPLERQKIKTLHKDKLIEGKIEDVFYPEFPAVIRKCLKKYYDAKKNGLDIPLKVKAFQSKLVRYSAKLDNWFDETLVYTGNPKHRLPTKYLYEMYTRQMEEGCIYSQKKLSNFRQELDKWLEVKRVEYKTLKEGTELYKGKINSNKQKARVLYDPQNEILESDGIPGDLEFRECYARYNLECFTTVLTKDGRFDDEVF